MSFFRILEWNVAATTEVVDYFGEQVNWGQGSSVLSSSNSTLMDLLIAEVAILVTQILTSLWKTHDPDTVSFFPLFLISLVHYWVKLPLRQISSLADVVVPTALWWQITMEENKENEFRKKRMHLFYFSIRKELVVKKSGVSFLKDFSAREVGDCSKNTFIGWVDSQFEFNPQGSPSTNPSEIITRHMHPPLSQPRIEI